MAGPIRAVLIATLALIGAPRSQTIPPPAFKLVPHVVATGLKGGYQVVPADLNNDGRPDLVAVASGLSELVWFENPHWGRHVLASGLSGLINAAAADLDGDGIPELALAHGFATTPARSAGIVSLLTRGLYPTEPWSIREIDRVPTAHRLRWFTRPETREKWLINSPLVGASVQATDERGATSIYFYRAPDWKRQLVTDAEQGVVHAIEPVAWEDVSGPVLLSAGFAGIHRYTYAGGQWTRTAIAGGDPAPWPKSGSSDVAVGRLGRQPFVAAIEPWHGHQVVVSRQEQGSWERRVIDGMLTDAHTIVSLDLDGDGRDEIVAGQRGGTRSVRVYAVNAAGDVWSMKEEDAGGMAAAGCAAVDLNADRRPDLACIGSATANLKWYENVPY